MEGQNRKSIVNHGRFKDFPRFDGDRFQTADGQDVQAGYFIFGIQGDDPELFNRFVVEVEEQVEEVVADAGAGDLELKIVADPGDSVLFEGVDVY